MDNININLCKWTYRKPALEYEEKLFSRGRLLALNIEVAHATCL
jgi:hypothetical protein